LRLLDELDQQPRGAAFWTAARQYPWRMNGPEQCVSLHALARLDGDLQDLSPQDIGFDRATMTEPLRRQLSLVFEAGGATFVLFPQVGIETGPGRYLTVDYLVAIHIDGRRCFLVLEVDGKWHRNRRLADAVRDAKLDLTVVRIPGGKVDREDFGLRLVRSLLARVPCNVNPE